MSVFFSAASMAGAFSGLLAFAIQQMHGVANLAGWRWIFILEGIATVLVGMLIPWVLPDSPERASWLTVEEKRFIRYRLERDSGTEKGRVDTLDHFHTKYLVAAITDWKLWFTVFIYWGNTYAACHQHPHFRFLFDLWLIFEVDRIPVYAFTFTAPTIIKDLGYTSAQAQLLTIPVYFAGLVSTIGFSWLADRRRSRWPFVVVPYGISLVGFLALLVIPHPKLPGLTYAFLFPITIGVYPAVITLVSWIANNIAPTSKRACGLAMSIMMGNFGGAIGSNIYLAQEAPRYWTGYGVSIACCALAIVSTFVLRWAYKRENWKRDQISEEEVRATYTEGTRFLTPLPALARMNFVLTCDSAELLDMGDKSPLYRYVY
jgi:MFS family permease